MLPVIPAQAGIQLLLNVKYNFSMLQALSIRDFIIVATLDLEFSSGFTTLTGETGAGKSILIDALSLALGERNEGAVIRAGAERADISEIGRAHV